MNAKKKMDEKKTATKQKRKIRLKIGFYPVGPYLLWIAATLITMLFFQHTGSLRYSEYTLGSVSREEVIAPFTFDILKSEDELKAEREEARTMVAPVYQHVDTVLQMQIDRLRGAFMYTTMARDSLRYYRRFGDEVVEERKKSLLNNLRNEYDVTTVSASSWEYLLGDLRFRSTRNTSPLKRSVLEPILLDIYGRGILNRTQGEIIAPDDRIKMIDNGEERLVEVANLFDVDLARKEVLDRLTADLEVYVAPGDSAIKVGYELLSSFVEPNVIYDRRETELRKDEAVAKVPIVKGIVLKDERVLDSNERITQHHLDILRSMELKRAELAREEVGFFRFLPWIGRFMLAGLIFFVFGYWMYRFRPDIFKRVNHLLLVWVVLLLHIIFYGVAIAGQELSPYLFPSALGAVILTIIFDAPVAIYLMGCLALIIGSLTGNDLFNMLMVFVPGALSVFAVLRVRTRVQIMKSSFLIMLGYVLILLIRRTLLLQFDASIWLDLVYAFGNSVATPLIALGMLILIEMIFRVTSDLTLLELADLNRPLLKRLSLEAPGTYHHSIMVGNLAEAGAEAISANALLVRAGAYYHDIGKMVRREYFVENQLGMGNIHDSLDPLESANMLAMHVTEGVELADKYRLPEAVKAFIREHHGTGLMMYFFNKALEEKPEGTVQESDFRYPGPKPQSKETGILMLADSAEAATRSLDDPSTERIEKVVRSVIISKYSDGEMDECPLTLNELSRITRSFIPILQGIHHHRIRYPSREELEKKREKAAAQAGNGSEAEE